MIVNQSNQNSSLVNSLMDATESIVNPFKYSIEKQLPFHSVSYIEHTPVNAASFGPNSTIDFDLTKLGFLRSAIFSWTTTTPVKTTHNPPSGNLCAIERIEILSASRRLAVMDRFALKCALSDMPYEIRSNYCKGLHQMANGKQLRQNESTAADSFDNHLFIPMTFFNNVKNALALSFIEPVKLRVVMTDQNYVMVDSNGATAGGTPSRGVCSISTPKLTCEYRILDAESEDQTIEANFDDVLTQLSYDYVTETESTGTLSATGELDMSVEIKDPGVVSSAYVIVQMDYADATTKVSTGASEVTAPRFIACEQPLEVVQLGFKASGQDIIPQTSARIFELYGRRNLSKDFHATGFGNTYQSDLDPTNLHNVYKLDFGLDDDNRYNSGGISMRELNAPTISVKVRRASGHATDLDETGGVDEGQGTASNTATGLGGNMNPGACADRKVKMRVILKKHVLLSTDPSSGRMVQAISN